MGHRELGPTPLIVESKAPRVNPKFAAGVCCPSEATARGREQWRHHRRWAALPAVA